MNFNNKPSPCAEKKHTGFSFYRVYCTSEEGNAVRIKHVGNSYIEAVKLYEKKIRKEDAIQK